MVRKVVAIIVLVAFALSILGGVLYYVYSRAMRTPEYYVTAPVLGRPAVVPRGSAFNIRIRAHQGLELDKVLIGPVVARGVSDYEIKILQTETNESGAPVGALVKPPYALAPGLYDLVAQFKIGSVNYIEDHLGAVRLVEPDATFTFAVMGDISNPGQSGFSADGVARLRDAAREISMLNPDFLVVLGGLGAGPWDARNYKALREILSGELLTPVIALPKAEDISEIKLLNYKLSDGAAQWRKYFPLMPFYFDREGYRFVFMFASQGRRPDAGGVSAESFAFLKKLVEKKEKPAKKLVIFLPDAPLARGDESFRGASGDALERRASSDLLEILKGRKAVIFTSGMLRDSVYGLSRDALIVNTGRGDELLPRYRFIEAGEKGLSGVHYIGSPNAIPFGKLRATYSKPNDGTSAANRIVVTNETRRDLAGLRIFAALAPLKSGDYEVAGADVITRVSAEKVAFLLSLDMKGSDRKIITIRKQPAASSRQRGKAKDRNKSRQE